MPPPTGGLGRIFMDCSKRIDLEQALEFGRIKYSEARSAVFYQVSTELAAKKKVDMERARYDLEEHKLICTPCAALDRLSETSEPSDKE
jgi:hypothetical protein